VGKGAHRRFQIGVANIIYLPNPRRGIMMRLTQSYRTRSARGFRIMGPVAAEKKALAGPAGGTDSEGRHQRIGHRAVVRIQLNWGRSPSRRDGDVIIRTDGATEWKYVFQRVPARMGRRNEMQSRSALPLQPSNVSGLEVLANGVLGVSIHTEINWQKIKPIARRHPDVFSMA
jgi:hypothetical protein